ncbi:MAG: hypothetical protein AAFS10_19540, partial [Myxococcota bacterium]
MHPSPLFVLVLVLLVGCGDSSSSGASSTPADTGVVEADTAVDTDPTVDTTVEDTESEDTGNEDTAVTEDATPDADEPGCRLGLIPGPCQEGFDLELEAKATR